MNEQEPDANLSRWNDAAEIERALGAELQRAEADLSAAERALENTDDAWSRIAKLRDTRDRVAVRHRNAQASAAHAKEVYEGAQRAKLQGEFDRLRAELSESAWHGNIEALVAQSAELQRQQDLLSARVQVIAQEREAALTRARGIAAELGMNERVAREALGVQVNEMTTTPPWWQWSSRFPWLVGRVLFEKAPEQPRFAPMLPTNGTSELLRQSMGETPAESALIERVSKTP